MLLTNQYNTGIFSCFLLLLPWFSSTCRQTNDENSRNVLEDCLWFSRTQLLHHFLDAVFHDEEDELISSTLHNWRLNILLVQHRSKFFPLISMVLVEEPAGSRLCGFASAFDRHAKSLAFNLNAYSSNCTSEVSCSLLFKFGDQFVIGHEKFRPRSENCLCSYT